MNDTKTPKLSDMSIAPDSVIDRIDELNREAWELRFSDSDHALKLAAEVHSLSKIETSANPYTSGVARAFLTTGIINLYHCHYGAALEHLDNAATLFTAVDEPGKLALALGNKGIACFHLGNYENALHCHMQSLAIRQRIDDKTGIGNSFQNIGNTYLEIADYANALEYYLKSLAIREELNDLPVIGGSLANLATLYRMLEDHPKALEYALRSLHLLEKTDDRINTARALGTVGNIYLSMTELTKALDHYLLSLDIFEEIGDEYGIGSSLQNLGRVYATLGENDKALQYYQKSLGICKEIEDKQGMGQVLLVIGELYTKKGDFEKASQSLHESLALAVETESKTLLFDVHELLAEVYKKNGDAIKALEHFEKFHRIKEEVYNEENSRKVANLQALQQISLMQRERDAEQREQQITENLLLKIMPGSIAERLKRNESRIADKIKEATVLFADIVGFTERASFKTADEVIDLLSEIFSAFDELAEGFGVEKIKTVGDQYMAAAGVPIAQEDHIERVARLALAMQDDIRINAAVKFQGLNMRIGFHTGEMIAGVLGTRKLAYDIWGDTVNTAARMESHGEPGKIQVSEEVFKKLNNKFTFESRGEIFIKGKGAMHTYFLLGEKV